MPKILTPLPKAIVGKDVNIQLSDNGSNYYLHNGIKYEVIGIAGIKNGWLDVAFI